MTTLKEIKAGINDALVEGVYQHFKNKRNAKYDEVKHCKLLIKIMLDYEAGTIGAFCCDAMISEVTFYDWVREHELFRNIYYYCKVVTRELWEEEGRKLRDAEYPMGTINHAFDYWKMIGWSRFGISRNSRLKLNLNDQDSPAQHYATILRQASEGDFTASEFKQLMEAVNVGLNVVQTIDMQKQIDELKSDLKTLRDNKGVENPFTNKGIA